MEQYRNQIRRSSATEVRCRNHPTHRQSPGVCSLCLREKLHQIYTTTTTSRVKTAPVESSSSSSSSLSSLSSSCSSMDASPIHQLYHDHSHKRSFMMEKSRSMAAVVTRDDHGMVFWKKRSSGFWSNLVGTRSRSKRINENGLMHAKSARERIITAN
ncbi:uncharacterized protein LOC124930307 [Impatiens glandulifera]|uniref:uncharacterized protein LOC124930307 n=1 Tax=Impatiens glandulifera TaxID=253017 RepID=UPI001FB0551E|nr:uncharacterized protein LOC124930307 [Impatiens glandulifera]